MFLIAFIDNASAAYGAISFSPSTGAHGSSYGFTSRQKAESRAQTECADYSDDCEVVIWFKNACGAVARGEGGAWASAWGNGRKLAESNALSECRALGDGCKVVVWACTN